MTEEALNPVELATEITIAWLGNQNNRVTADDVPAFLRVMHRTLLDLGSGPADGDDTPQEALTAEYQPAVSVRKSLASKDHIISMIDGKPYKTLRRHLSTHGLTDVQYRERYNLRPDYPMVSENYSLARRTMAKQIGLGRKKTEAKPEAAAPAPATTPAKRTRGKAAETADSN